MGYVETLLRIVLIGITISKTTGAGLIHTVHKFALSMMIVGCLCCVHATAVSGDLPEFRLTIEQHRFTPGVLEIPSGQKIRLVVENRDATPEEFESYDLNREKVVAGKASIIVFIGPLKPGSYEYFGDFNPQVARGHIVVK